MKRIYAGFVVLATLIMMPLSAAITMTWADQAPFDPPILLPLMKVGLALAAGLVLVVLFARRSALRFRVALHHPGASLMLAGTVLTLTLPTVLAVIIVKSVGIPPGAWIVAHGLQSYPGFIVLCAGAWQVLRNLGPSPRGVRAGQV